MSRLLGWSWDLLLGLLDDGLVGRQGAAPEPVEVGAQRGQAGRVDAVDPAVAGRLVDDQPGVLEDLEVLGDGWAADRQAAGDLADGARTLGEPLEDRAAGGVPRARPRGFFRKLAPPQ